MSVKFAEFHEHDWTERWHGVEVRSLEAADLGAVARVFAQRENVTHHRAEEVVSRWLEPSPKRFVLVAEHDGQVQGYGKAEWLDPDDAGGDAPTGWYLTGVVVTPTARRHGVGAALTEERIARLSRMTREVWYFANSHNRATIALHASLGFALQTRDFDIPGVTFEGGQGALFRLLIK
jgi:ribosomal protein S18 acetylase RimI-like enzyme